MEKKKAVGIRVYVICEHMPLESGVRVTADLVEGKEDGWYHFS